MNKYKVGDEVVIRADLVAEHNNRPFSLGLNYAMMQFAGQTTTVMKVLDDNKYNLMCIGGYTWSLRMFDSNMDVLMSALDNVLR